MASLVLASASPRRRELLAELGVCFEIDAGDVPEIPEPGERAEAFARRMARDKATEVARGHPGQFVLAADTVVVADKMILGKPRDRADARRMLQILSDRSHRVLTAVALMRPDSGCDELVVESTVVFKALTARQIETYLDSGEPFDKAGAYAIQGLAQEFVRRVRGSRSNVIGLPLDEVGDLLRRRMPMRRHASA